MLMTLTTIRPLSGERDRERDRERGKERKMRCKREKKEALKT